MQQQQQPTQTADPLRALLQTQMQGFVDQLVSSGNITSDGRGAALLQVEEMMQCKGLQKIITQLPEYADLILTVPQHKL